MRKLFIIFGIFLILPLSVSAATFKGAEDYTLAKNEVIEGNLFVGAGTISLNGTVEGDGTLAGGTVTVTGSIVEDLSVTGGSLSILGSVGDDVKLAGGNITVDGTVGGELTAAGGFIHVLTDAVVKEGVTLTGRKLIFDGLTEGDLKVYGEDVEVRGTVNGNIEGKVEQLVLGESAVVSGNLEYSSPNEADIHEGATVKGNIKYTYIDKRSGREVDVAFADLARFVNAALFSLLLLKYLAFLLAGVLLTLWFTKKSNVLVKRTRKNFSMDLLLGFAAAILAPIAFGLMMVTGVGAVLGTLGMTVGVLLGLIAAIYAGVLLGVSVRDAVSKKKDTPADWKSALLGQTFLAVVMFVPILGWIFGAVLFLAVSGSIIRLAYDRFWMTR